MTDSNLKITDEMVERAAREDWQISQRDLAQQHRALGIPFTAVEWDNASEADAVRTTIRRILTTAFHGKH
jgi:hypothetical protein